MITDYFLIKSEYYWMQEDNNEQDFVDEMFEHDSEDSIVYNYISDKGKDDNDTEDVEDDKGVKNNETTPKANYLCPYYIQHKPEQYHAMMNDT